MKLVPILGLLVAISSIQGGASLAKGLFPVVGPEGATALRTALAFLVLAAITRPWRNPPPRQAWPSLLVYGASLGAMNLTFYKSLERIPLGIAVALEFTGPLGVAFLTSRRRIEWLWALLATAGILLIVPRSPASAGADWIGMGYALAAGLFWGLYILAGQRAAETVPGGQASTIGMFFAAAVTLPFGLAGAGVRLLDPAILPWAFGVAVLSSALPYRLEMVALRALPPQTFGTLMSIEPAFAALSGLIFLEERLSGVQWVAIALIMIASAGASLGNRPHGDAGAAPEST